MSKAALLLIIVTSLTACAPQSYREKDSSPRSYPSGHSHLVK